MFIGIYKILKTNLGMNLQAFWYFSRVFGENPKFEISERKPVKNRPHLFNLTKIYTLS